MQDAEKPGGRYSRAELRSARRALRDLEGLGRGPSLHVRVRIGGEEWGSPGDVIGLVGLTTVLPLTPAGIRSLTRTLRAMRKACVRSLARDARERQNRAARVPAPRLVSHPYKEK